MRASNRIEHYPNENSPGLQAGVPAWFVPRVPQGRQKGVPVVPSGLVPVSHQFPSLKAGAIFEEDGLNGGTAELLKQIPAVGIPFGVPSSDGSAYGWDRALSCGVAQTRANTTRPASHWTQDGQKGRRSNNAPPQEQAFTSASIFGQRIRRPDQRWYTSTMPSLFRVKVAPSRVPVVVPAPRQCMVSVGPDCV